MNVSRLTPDECQAIANRTLESLTLDAAETLDRFEAGERHRDEVLTDGATGKPFRRRISAVPAGIRLSCSESQ